MSVLSQRQLWPYDEVKIILGQSPNQFIVQTPWLETTFGVEPHQFNRVLEIAEKLNTRNISPNDMSEISGLFSTLEAYPFSYVLPLKELKNGLDQHERNSSKPLASSPKNLLLELGETSKPKNLNFVGSQKSFENPWSWDLESALELSQTESGHDPYTLFSIARRYHLLDSIDSNKTSELKAYVEGLKSNIEKFKTASSLAVRQNHYVTERCESSLRPALKIAQRAEEAVFDFIQAEAGHDVILGRAMESLGVKASEVPAIEPIIILMDLFREIAQRNFLAFSMVVDIFERSSYQEHDPLAEMLTAGGLDKAASQVDVHKDINDEGEHENVALGFLSYMAPVSPEYAKEALQMAEVLTIVMHQVSSSLLLKLRGEK